MYFEQKPHFPFGYGLTYSGFEYSGLKTGKKTIKDGDVIDVTFTLKNMGDYNNDEVSQLYVSYPGADIPHPPIALKGFKRTFVPNGETVEVTIPLLASNLKCRDVSSHSWKPDPGILTFFVEGSSADKRVEGEIIIKD